MSMMLRRRRTVYKSSCRWCVNACRFVWRWGSRGPNSNISASQQNSSELSVSTIFCSPSLPPHSNPYRMATLSKDARLTLIGQNLDIKHLRDYSVHMEMKIIMNGKEWSLCNGCGALQSCRRRRDGTSSYTTRPTWRSRASCTATRRTSLRSMPGNRTSPTLAPTSCYGMFNWQLQSVAEKISVGWELERATSTLKMACLRHQGNDVWGMRVAERHELPSKGVGLG